ncbi:MAG: PaaI family thioesterase [Pseudomonadota bacterium]
MADDGRGIEPKGRYVDRFEDMPGQAEIAPLTGLEYMTAIMDGTLPAAPIARTMGFWCEEVTFGRAVFRGRPKFEVYNPIGSVHGGWFGAILDSALACSVHSTLPAGKGYTTLEYKVGLLRAVHAGGQDFLAIGEVVHAGRRTGSSEAKLIGAEDGKTYATGTTTCLVLDLT